MTAVITGAKSYLPGLHGWHNTGRAFHHLHAAAAAEVYIPSCSLNTAIRLSPPPHSNRCRTMSVLCPPRAQLLQFKGLGNLEDDVRLLLSQLQRMQVDHAASDRRTSAVSELRGLVRAGEGRQEGWGRGESSSGGPSFHTLCSLLHCLALAYFF